MGIFKRSFRSSKQKQPISQYLTDQSPKEETKKMLVQNRSDAGRIRRRNVKQVAGGEGKIKQWWKAISVSGRNKSVNKNENIPDEEE